MTRLQSCLAELRRRKRKAFVPFIMAGDPTRAASRALLHRLPEAGADIIELGMPFSDPMADGPTIQAAGKRALAGGQTLARTLAMVQEFRRAHARVPLVLMGYYNPIYRYGAARFLRDAEKAGVDGLIIVDLPPEEDAELCLPSQATQIDFIRLITPTSDAVRLAQLLPHASGFLYYVAVLGVTGTKRVALQGLGKRLAAVRAQSALPIMLGFGIATAADARAAARIADGVVVGSAIVERAAHACRPSGMARTLAFARQIGKTIHQS